MKLRLRVLSSVHLRPFPGETSATPHLLRPSHMFLSFAPVLPSTETLRQYIVHGLISPRRHLPTDAKTLLGRSFPSPIFDATSVAKMIRRTTDPGLPPLMPTCYKSRTWTLSSYGRRYRNFRLLERVRIPVSWGVKEWSMLVRTRTSSGRTVHSPSMHLGRPRCYQIVLRQARVHGSRNRSNRLAHSREGRSQSPRWRLTGRGSRSGCR